ncbi:hypothetical protein [Halomicrobium salinisoli]|uniref:hypothetical protein n=1 Tax=Halomicrobium salinisoli TaxID=2878391 RepID=UPI001CF06FAD|nr:hypothetical protein [Halomicrobium salinisoli]
MVSRRTIALLAVAAIAVAAVALPAVAGGKPTLAVENEDDEAYRVTVYAAEDRQRAMATNFEITTRDGERRLATLGQLYWPDGHRNVTLADEGVPSESVRVGPGESSNATFEGWPRGHVTFTMAERRNGSRWVHEWTNVGSCGDTGQEITVTLEEGGASWSSSC